jgi:hypothetical protein
MLATARSCSATAAAAFFFSFAAWTAAACLAPNARRAWAWYTLATVLAAKKASYSALNDASADAVALYWLSSVPMPSACNNIPNCLTALPL